MCELGSNWITASTYMWIDIHSFKDSDNDGAGDIKGLISKLDYPRDIGIRAIMFPGITLADFAYSATMVTRFYGVDPRLGTLTDFNQLVERAHMNGIKVVFGWSSYSTHPDRSIPSLSPATHTPLSPRSGLTILSGVAVFGFEALPLFFRLNLNHLLNGSISRWNH